MSISEEKTKELAKQESKRDEFMATMSNIAERFTEQLADELPERWDQVARRFFKQYPERAKGIGRDGVAKIKSRLDELSQRKLDIARSHLSGREVWRHENPKRNFHAENYKRDYLSSHSDIYWSWVSDGIAIAESEARTILKAEMDLGRREDLSGNKGGSLSEELEVIVKEYADMDSELREVDDLIQNLEKAIDQAEAAELWDSV